MNYIKCLVVLTLIYGCENESNKANSLERELKHQEKEVSDYNYVFEHKVELEDSEQKIHKISTSNGFTFRWNESLSNLQCDSDLIRICKEMPKRLDDLLILLKDEQDTGIQTECEYNGNLKIRHLTLALLCTIQSFPCAEFFKREFDYSYNSCSSTMYMLEYFDDDVAGFYNYAREYFKNKDLDDSRCYCPERDI